MQQSCLNCLYEYLCDWKPASTMGYCNHWRPERGNDKGDVMTDHMKPTREYKIYAVDFDGTLCENVWPSIGLPNLCLISHLIKRRKESNKVILWTCRSGERLDEAIEWCRQHSLEFDAVNKNLPEMIDWYGDDTRKISADVYIDDKAVIKPEFNMPFLPKTENRKERMIKIKYFTNEIEKLHYIEGKSDWIDLRAAKEVQMKTGDFQLIPLGIAMELPKGYEAHVVPRSSTYKQFGIIQTNSMGIIDESYCGDNDQWFFPAYALRDTVIHANDRICQFRIMKHQPVIEFEEVSALCREDRGGHGSTGRQ